MKIEFKVHKVKGYGFAVMDLGYLDFNWMNILESNRSFFVKRSKVKMKFISFLLIGEVGRYTLRLF